MSSAMTFFQGKVRTFSWTFFTIHERQKSIDVVYAATLNYEADDDKSEKEDETVPF